MTDKRSNKLLLEISSAKKKVKVGDRYFHYKNPKQFYSIIELGIIEETQKVSIIYRAEYGDKLIWIRPLDNFFEKVTLENGTKVDRFTKVN